MSKWTHSICDECWTKREKNRMPVRVNFDPEEAPMQKCCFCGVEHKSGIYVREDPKSMLCGGEHAEDD